jgi:Tol biopolymer transport system component/predicted Ser/Thr protein kinase
MALSAGDKLGPYEIIALIGKGGMGEVYRARDTRLGRDVAVKISQEQFNERFEREAKVVASLNHPNICSLYDVGPNYLVMEYVEGESPDGPMPVEEAMEIARQIAEALGEAHEKGVVHRDLKPANIKIKPDGTVKVLDFGLAKIGGGPAMMSEDSPTISMAATQAGVILGTAAYMAPEQARGKRVDARADIWAFGVVLYELITGQRLFKGEDLTDTLASVVKEQPDLSAIPPRVRRLLEACLQKDPKKRLQAIGDMRLVLEGAEPPPSPSGLAGRVGWVVAGVALLLAAGLGFVHFRETPAAERSLRLSIPLPENASASFLEISPDGKRVLLALAHEGIGQLYLRSLDSGELQPLSGTTAARTPFWSPDNRFIGFFAESKLKVIPAAGGPAQVLCGETGLGSGGTWNRDGIILFGVENGHLRRVDANKGGQCTAVGKDDPNDRARLPVFLPDGNHFFYVRQTIDQASQGIYLATLADPVGRKVLSDNSSVVYSPPGFSGASAGGRAHLLFLRENTLMAQPFDEASLQPVGDPFSVATGASSSPTRPQVAASVASDGTLVYLAGRSRETQLTWFDRTGKELGKVGPRANQRGVALSPDGSTVAIVRQDQNGAPATWLHDLVRESESRLQPPGSPGSGALWSPDSSLVWFGMSGPEGLGIYQKDLKGGRLQFMQKIDPAEPDRTPSDWSRDGRFVIYTENNPKTRADIWYAPVESGPVGSRKMNEKAAVKLLATDAVESQGQLSPDGKWLAYFSDESGHGQVYIRPFPSGSQVWKVSADSGREPRWRSDGKELYFTDSGPAAQVMLMAAMVDADGRGGLRIGPPQKMFAVRATATVVQSNIFAYSPHPDRQRFLVNALVETGEPTVNVITNWQKSVAGAK